MGSLDRPTALLRIDRALLACRLSSALISSTPFAYSSSWSMYICCLLQVSSRRATYYCVHRKSEQRVNTSVCEGQGFVVCRVSEIVREYTVTVRVPGGHSFRARLLQRGRGTPTSPGFNFPCRVHYSTSQGRQKLKITSCSSLEMCSCISCCRFDCCLSSLAISAPLGWRFTWSPLLLPPTVLFSFSCLFFQDGEKVVLGMLIKCTSNLPYEVTRLDTAAGKLLLRCMYAYLLKHLSAPTGWFSEYVYMLVPKVKYQSHACNGKILALTLYRFKCFAFAAAGQRLTGGGRFQQLTQTNFDYPQDTGYLLRIRVIMGSRRTRPFHVHLRQAVGSTLRETTSRRRDCCLWTLSATSLFRAWDSASTACMRASTSAALEKACGSDERCWR